MKDKTEGRGHEAIEDFETFVARLTSDDLRLSRRLRQVARFVLDNPEDVAIYNIVELAAKAEVPASTITRFTKELGIGGFAELQAVFRERLIGPRGRLPRQRRSRMGRKGSERDLDLENPGAVFDTFIESGRETLLRLQEEIDRDALKLFVDVLVPAPTVHLVSARGAFGVGAYCYYGFSQVGKHAVLVDNLGAMRAEQMRFVRPDDVVLALTFDAYTPETIEIAHQAAAQGRNLLCITDNPMSPVASLGMGTLYVREARLGHFRSQIPAMALCQSIIVSVGRRLSRA